MPLDANTEYEIERAKKLLDSYAKEFGEADQCDLRVYQAGEILGRLLLPKKPAKKTFVGTIGHVSGGAVPAAVAQAALGLAAVAPPPPVKCKAAFVDGQGWSCECGLPTPGSCPHAAGRRA